MKIHFMYRHEKKRGLLYLLLHPVAEASRIAHHQERSNAEAHAEYVTMLRVHIISCTATCLHIPVGHLPLLCSVGDLVCETFLRPKNKALSKRLCHRM